MAAIPIYILPDNTVTQDGLRAEKAWQDHHWQLYRAERTTTEYSTFSIAPNQKYFSGTTD